MEMHQIRYFLAVADRLNFTRAAEACNVSQPSLTRAVKLLEDELGGALFFRDRANTRLSELSRTVHPHLQQVYDGTHAVSRAASDFTLARRSRLRLGVMCTIAPTMLIDLISSVHGRHPGVEIEIRDSNAHDLDKQLLDGDLDVAIYCIPGKGPDQRVHAMPLFREQMMIVLPPDHALAGKNAILLKDLHGEKYLNRTSCEFNGYADQFFDEQGVECETIYYSDRDDWIQAMIRAGLGFGFMPEHAVTSPHVVARPIVEPAFWREVNLITVRDRPHSPSVGALVREAMRVKWNGVPAISVTNAAARPSEP